MQHPRTHRLAAAGLALTLVVGLAACGSSSGSDSSGGGGGGGSAAITSLDSLCGHSVAVEKGTTQETDATAQSKTCTKAGKGKVNVLSFDDQGAANLALSSGRADAAMADSPVAAYAVKQSNGKFKLSGTSYGNAPYGIAVPKDAGHKGLAQAVQAALVKLQADGSYDKIMKQWGIEDGAVKVFPINGATGGKAAPSTADPKSLVPAAVKSSGKLVVAADASYAPNEFFDTDGKTVIGMDADLAKAIGKELGLTVEVTNATFDNIIPALGTRYDLGMSSFTDNADREKTVDFVDYFSAGTSFYVPA